MLRAFAAPLVVALGLAGWSTPAAAQQPLIVVELFTSQGCNSCPPADAYLLDLMERQQRDGLLVLGYHVNYWDYLGWADIFAGEEMTSRQRDYVAPLDTRSMYTPQIVVGGRYDTVGSDRSAVEAAIAADRARPLPGAPDAMWFSADEGGATLHVGSGAFTGRADIWLVMFGEREDVEIPRGENAGRRIVYGNVVRDIEHLGTWSGGAVEIAVPAGLWKANMDGCAAILQIGGQGPILAAARVDLPIHYN